MKSFFAIISIVVVACQPQESLRTQIEAMEEEAKNSNVVDTSLAFSLVRAYGEFAEQNPGDSITPYYLQRSADILRVQPQREMEAIARYQLIIENYPEHPQAARSLFMIGFTYDENLQKKAKAIRYYGSFLKKYPNHPLANDAYHLKDLLADSNTTDLDKVKQWMEKAEGVTNANQ